jgi:sulfate-transporting ATPase
MGRTFQGLELFEDVTVKENLLTGAERHPGRAMVRDVLFPRRAELSPEQRAIVARLGLLDILDRKPPELSFGQRRLVSVARALSSRPKVLLLDEPAAGLNHHESQELGHVIRWLAEDAGIAILLVEHDVSLVMSCSDRVAVLDFGSLIANGPPAEVATSRRVVAAYLGEDVADLEEDPVALDVGRSV